MLADFNRLTLEHLKLFHGLSIMTTDIGSHKIFYFFIKLLIKTVKRPNFLVITTISFIFYSVFWFRGLLLRNFHLFWFCIDNSLLLIFLLIQHPLLLLHIYCPLYPWGTLLDFEPFLPKYSIQSDLCSICDLMKRGFLISRHGQLIFFLIPVTKAAKCDATAFFDLLVEDQYHQEDQG